MTLKHRLQSDLQDAMRAKDQVRKRALRLVLAEAKNKEIEVGRELTDEEVVAVLQKEAKQHRETLEELGQIDRPEMEATQKAELAVLAEYLPDQLGHAEIEELARTVISELSVEDPSEAGQVMRVLMPQVRGRADGKLVNQVVRDLLNNRG